MISHPSTSAVIAIHKPDKRHLQQAVSPVLEQTYPVPELIIVNDGDISTAAENWLPEDNRIRFFCKKNGEVAYWNSITSSTPLKGIIGCFSKIREAH